MTKMQLLEALSQVDEADVAQADQIRTPTKPAPRRRSLRGILLAAALILALLTGVCAYGEGQWFSPYQEEPAQDPVEVVRSSLENQSSIGALVMEIRSLEIDRQETQRLIALYSGSDLAESRGWSDEYLQEHFVVVRAIYYAEYDHTKTPLADGETVWFYHLTRDPETMLWVIEDSGGPNGFNDT
ncbi:MAG: hypothetical protein E7459_05980 [Ruminococcaceae bacterium]|nr:hypothetical protein [Oscillospiraceae bacterium]